MNTQQNSTRIPVMSNDTFAGSAIPDDWQNWEISGFRDIRAIENASFYDRFIGVPIVGDSLKMFGIIHGDLLVTKITTQYEADKIGIWQTPHGRTAKFAFENPDGTVTLHNKNGWKQIWQANEIKLVGLVVRVERDL